MGQQFTTLQRCIEVDVSLNALNIAGLHGHDEEYKLSMLSRVHIWLDQIDL